MKNKDSIIIGLGSCGIASGAQDIYDYLNKVIEEKGLALNLEKAGCIGMCYREPIVEVKKADGDNVMYENVNIDQAARIVDEHILNNEKVKEIAVDLAQENKDGVLAKQYRIALRNCGIVNPESIDDYLERDGYKAIEKVISSYNQDQVIEEVKRSGLRGRGGAGFSTGMKWTFGKRSLGDKKYLICNADEGDPGAFMDRGLLESDPHAVIEGMIIAAYAIGASYGYIYARAEYPLAIKRLEIAINQAKEKKLLGDNILDSNFSFDIKVKEGAGAFVCGEETALIHSIEGKRGMPRRRPPFPAESGLWKYPTIINNVETLANVAWIVLNGADAYAALGTEKSKGTKVFALAGDITKGGLIEVPMGITLKEIVYDIGGGSSSDKKIKAVQLGGPSGGCLPTDLLDKVVDYEELMETGAIVGSGGMVVMDERSCMVDVAKFFLQFTQTESCGKCTFCRVGTKRMLEILTRITEGKGKESDIDLLEELADKVKNTSLCGLGQTAPNPVLTTLKYFKSEYIAHIKDKKCPAVKCQNLLSYTIIKEKCIGCTACLRSCPVYAVFGEKKKPHVIDEYKCIKCGNCFKRCKFDAIEVK